MGDFWKPTADMFTSLFEKPKMAEKLLIKPPFKYIYDIFAETTKSTNFAKGLYSGDELSQEYYETKDRKMAYLQKMIDLVELMSKEQVLAKPGKIVAGLEPELTNILLQQVYKLASSGQNSQPFVKKILTGGKVEQKPQEKPKAPAPPVKQEKADSKDKKKPEPPQEKKPEPKVEPKVEPKKEEKKGGKLDMKEQEPAPKMEPPVEQKKVVRPPSAKKQPKQPEPPAKQQPSQPAILDEDEVQRPAQKPAPKKDIQAAEYSKRVQEAMEQEDIPEPEATRNEDPEPSNKIQMGNLRKNKKDSTRLEKGPLSGGGELTDKQLEMLKGMIQNICQNSTPLGKSIEFINDDIESMNTELLSWRKQYNDSKTKMQSELKITEDALVPLYDKLAEIDEQMKDQKGKIQNMKTQIIKNQSTIKSLLYSVVTTKS